MEEVNGFFKIIDEIEFIAQYITNLEKQKKEYSDSLEYCRLQLAHIEEMRRELREKEDQSFSFFSPNEQQEERNEKELEQKEENMNQERSALEEEIAHLDRHIIYFKKMQEMIKNYNQLMEQNLKNTAAALDDCKYKTAGWGINVLETQEEERKRIARELHDSTVQNMTNFAHKTELCLKLVDMDTIRVKLELQAMIDSIHETINDMRNIIYDLRPMSIDDLGLCVTAERYVNRMNNQYTDNKIRLRIVNEEVELPSVVTLTLFRIIQEACNNALKYAESEKIDIMLTYGNESIDIEVHDDGKGFDLVRTLGKRPDNNANSGFGLSIMKERVYLLSGSIDIQTNPGEGTTIKVKIPYIKEKRKEDSE